MADRTSAVPEEWVCIVDVDGTSASTASIKRRPFLVEELDGQRKSPSGYGGSRHLASTATRVSGSAASRELSISSREPRLPHEPRREDDENRY